MSATTNPSGSRRSQFRLHSYPYVTLPATTRAGVLPKDKGSCRFMTLDSQRLATKLYSQPVEPDTTIVIQVGSRNMRLSKATSAIFHSYPHVIARRSCSSQQFQRHGPEPKEEGAEVKSDPHDDDDHAANDDDDGGGGGGGMGTCQPQRPYGNGRRVPVGFLPADLSRSHSLNSAETFFLSTTGVKKLTLHTSRSQVHAYNKTSTGELVPKHDDPTHSDWAPSPDVEYVTGPRAFHVQGFERLYPMYLGTVNWMDYSSWEVWEADVERIWRHALGEELGLREFKGYGVVLVLSDLLSPDAVLRLINICFKDLNFSRVLPVQESVATSFGSGLPTTTILDIGATKTLLTHLDNGDPYYRAFYPYGGDDITIRLYELLRESYFPVRGVDLWVGSCWKAVEEVKERFASVRGERVGVRAVEVWVREVGRVAERYRVKVFEEPFLAALLFFFPDPTLCAEKLLHWCSTPYLSRLTQARAVTDLTQTSMTYFKDPTTADGQPARVEESGGGPKGSKSGYIPVGLGDKALVSVCQGFVERVPKTVDEAKVEVEGGGEAGEGARGMVVGGEEDAGQEVRQRPGLRFRLRTRGYEEQLQQQELSEASSAAAPPAASLPPHPPLLAPHTPPTAPAPLATPNPRHPFSEWLQTTLALPLDAFITRHLDHPHFTTRKHPSTTLILTGGGCKLDGFCKLLEARLSSPTPTNPNPDSTSTSTTTATSTTTTCKILKNPKDLDPASVPWKGGCVLARLESASDQWIWCAEWESWAGGYVLDRAAFVRF